MVKVASEALLRQVSGNPKFAQAFPQMMKLVGTKKAKCTTCRHARAQGSKYSGPVFAYLIQQLPPYKLTEFKSFIGATGIQVTIGQTVKVL